MFERFPAAILSFPRPFPTLFLIPSSPSARVAILAICYYVSIFFSSFGSTFPSRSIVTFLHECELSRIHSCTQESAFNFMSFPLLLEHLQSLYVSFPRVIYLNI
jgi:hypothetical protein